MHDASKLLPALLACMACAPALGHALVERTSPSADAVLADPPANVSVQFDAQLEPLFSKLTVTDAQGAQISQGSAVAQENPRVLTARISAPARGVCHVHWDVVSRDGHRSRGDYRFTIR